MYKIKRLLYIHIILIYFTFIYTSHDQHQLKRQVYASKTIIAPSTTTSSDDVEDLDEMSEERIKMIKEQYKQLAKEIVFDMKGKPDPPSSEATTKAFVPRAMLEEYIKMRESVREIIPDDRDFYGKIDIDALDQTHEDFWSAVYNRYGTYDISVDMKVKEEGLESRKFHHKGEASHIAYIGTTGDPKDVPPNIEPHLPPHSLKSQRGKKFISVHLKFNLTQEVYGKPSAADDLTGAELHLAREAIFDCEYRECDKSLISNHSGDDNPVKVPKYQRVYILQIHGYDQMGEPLVNIFSSYRVNVHESTPLVVNLYQIVKVWLMDPSKNYGIIVRVTNDDDDYEKILQSKSASQKKSGRPIRSSADETKSNASTQEKEEIKIPQRREATIVEHVRLKREFRATSESDNSWQEKQPSILIYSKTSNKVRKHVKRHHVTNDDTSEGMQADEPDTTTRDYTTSTSSSTSSTSSNYEQLVSDISAPPSSQTERSTDAQHTPTTSPSGSVGRREHASSIGVSGRRSHSNRNPSRHLSQHHSTQRPRGKGKSPLGRQVERCSLRSLSINFDEVGWSSWIIAPHAYHANYCAGDCTWPLTDVQNATNHAIIQAIYHSVGRVVPKSCCAPVKLGRVAILYQLDGIVQMKQYDDMIVEACGCL